MPTKYGFETAAERADREQQEVLAMNRQIEAARKDIDAKIKSILEDYLQGSLGLSIPLVLPATSGQMARWRGMGHKAVTAISEPDPHEIGVALKWDSEAACPFLSITFRGSPTWPEQEKLLLVLQQETGLRVDGQQSQQET